jgi:formate-dependent phosphoribosylglycinamide formyltransferase (GAR transformylase)
MINLSKVDSFPELTRSGRVSEELQQIINALVSSSENGDRFALTGIEAGKAYNSMQQRIRAQAKKLNLKVVIRFDASEQKLYFKATKDNNSVSNIKASDVKAIKTANKVTTK